MTRELFVGFRHYFKNYLSDFDVFSRIICRISTFFISLQLIISKIWHQYEIYQQKYRQNTRRMERKHHPQTPTPARSKTSGQIIRRTSFRHPVQVFCRGKLWKCKVNSHLFQGRPRREAYFQQNIQLYSGANYSRADTFVSRRDTGMPRGNHGIEIFQGRLSRTSCHSSRLTVGVRPSESPYIWCRQNP